MPHFLKFDPSKSPQSGDFRFVFKSTTEHCSPPLEGLGEVKIFEKIVRHYIVTNTYLVKMVLKKR
jgi:hypothetical protein